VKTTEIFFKKITKKLLSSTSLGAKFVVLVVVILSVAMSFTTFVNVKDQYQLLSSQLDAKGKMIGDYIAITSPEYILSNDFFSLNESMKAITLEEDTIYSVIIDSNGRLLTNYINKNDPIIIQEISNIQNFEISKLLYQIKKNNDIVYMEFPIIFNNEYFGVYQIGINKDRINALVQGMFIDQVVYNMAIIFFLVVCIYIVFIVSALEPIRNLIAGSQRVAEGGLTTEVERVANDELGS